MTLKEKLKAYLDEDILDKAEYDLLMSKLGDDDVETKNVEEPQDEEVKEEPKEGETKDDIHPNIPDGKEETTEEIVEEAKTETVEDEANETPEEQAAEEDALVKENLELKSKLEEMGKAFDGVVARLEAVEKSISGLSVSKEVKNEEDVGLSGKGKVANGGEELRDESRALKGLMGYRE